MLSSLLEEHESPGTSAGSTPDSQQGFIAPPAIPQISLRVPSPAPSAQGTGHRCSLMLLHEHKPLSLSSHEALISIQDTSFVYKPAI